MVRLVASRFRSTHYAVAWVAFGALVLHVAVKLPVIRDALSRPTRGRRDRPEATGARPAAAWCAPPSVASGVAVLAVAGSTVPWLRTVSVFETHDGRGPQDLPVNKSRPRRRGDRDGRSSRRTRLEVVHGGRVRTLVAATTSRRCRSTTATLPIACVEGWSAGGDWTGVRLRDLLDLVDAPARLRRSRSTLAPAARRLPGHRGAAATSPTTTATLLALRPQRRAAGASTTATRAG